MVLATKTKRKMGSKPKEYFALIGETVSKLRNIVNAMTNKMWEIGKILDEQLKSLLEESWMRERDEATGQFIEGSFYEDVAKQLNDDITPMHLKSCVTFYRRYPNLAEKVEKTGLTPTHYERLSHLPIKEAEKFEKIASEEKLTVRELREKAMPHRVELEVSEVEETYHDFANNLVGLEEAMEKLSKSDLDVLTKTQINGMARSIFVFVRKSIPRFVVKLEEEGAKLDPAFKKYVEKFI